MKSFFRISALIAMLALTSQASAQSGNALVVELESLSGQSSFSPFVVVNDAAASGGAAIEWPNNGSNQNFGAPSDTASGQVQIQFTLSQTANVQFQIQVNFAGADNDSFHYKLNAGSWVTQNNQATSGYGTITPATFSNLAAGTHTLRIVRREDGAKLDRVTLTASTGTISAGSSSSSSSSSSSTSSSSSGSGSSTSSSSSSGSCTSSSSSSASSSSGGFDATNCNLDNPQNWPCYYNTTSSTHNMCGCISSSSSGGVCGCSTRPACSNPSVVWSPSQCTVSSSFQPCSYRTPTGFWSCSSNQCGGSSSSSSSTSTSSSTSSSSSSSGTAFVNVFADMDDFACPSTNAPTASSETGYSGGSYLDLTSGTTRVDFPERNITSVQAAEHEVRIRYANGSTIPAEAELYINGERVDSTSSLFPSTGGWSNWNQEVIRPFPLNSQVSLVMPDSGGQGLLVDSIQHFWRLECVTDGPGCSASVSLGECPNPLPGGSSSSSSSSSSSGGYAPCQPLIRGAGTGPLRASITWWPQTGVTVTKYRIRYTHVSSGINNFIEMPGNATTVTISQLRAGESYVLAVTAINEFGESPESASRTITPTGLGGPSSSSSSGAGGIVNCTSSSSSSSTSSSSSGSSTSSTSSSSSSGASSSSTSSSSTSSSSSSSSGGSCPNIATGGNSGNFNTTGPYCFRVQSAVNGWGVSNFAGRTISVTINGSGTAVTTIGAPLPAKGSSDYYHFSSTAGTYPYASVYWW